MLTNPSVVWSAVWIPFKRCVLCFPLVLCATCQHANQPIRSLVSCLDSLLNAVCCASLWCCVPLVSMLTNPSVVRSAVWIPFKCCVPLVSMLTNPSVVWSAVWIPFKCCVPLVSMLTNPSVVWSAVWIPFKHCVLCFPLVLCATCQHANQPIRSLVSCLDSLLNAVCCASLWCCVPLVSMLTNPSVVRSAVWIPFKCCVPLVSMLTNPSVVWSAVWIPFKCCVPLVSMLTNPSVVWSAVWIPFKCCVPLVSMLTNPSVVRSAVWIPFKCCVPLVSMLTNPSVVRSAVFRLRGQLVEHTKACQRAEKKNLKQKSDCRHLLTTAFTITCLLNSLWIQFGKFYSQRRQAGVNTSSQQVSTVKLLLCLAGRPLSQLSQHNWPNCGWVG